MRPPFNPVKLVIPGAPPHFDRMTIRSVTSMLAGVVLAALVSRCGSRTTPSPSSPSTINLVPVPVAPVPIPTITFHVTGIVTEDDGKPIAGATVIVQPWLYRAAVPPVSGMTDGNGFYSLDADANGVGLVKAESA